MVNTKGNCVRVLEIHSNPLHSLDDGGQLNFCRSLKMIDAITLVVEVIELVVILGIFCVIVNNEEMRRIIQSELQKKFGHVKPNGYTPKRPLTTGSPKGGSGVSKKPAKFPLSNVTERVAILCHCKYPSPTRCYKCDPEHVVP